MTKHIAFLDFWHGFDKDNNFILSLFQSVNPSIRVVHPDAADTIIFSCFGQNHTNYKTKKRIFFTGENRRPDYTNCDYSISFDFDSYDNRNIRIPLWYYYIDWFNKGSYTNPDYLIPVDYIDSDENIFSTKKKTKFCAAVFSNPVKTRIDMVNILNTYKHVDCYGTPRQFINMAPGERFKMDVISDYKFSICFENTIHSGYYTEKLLHAKIAGNIPIYHADKNMNIDFNTKGCLNLTDYNSIYEMFEYIKEIDNDDILYRKILDEPLFNKLSIETIKNSISKILI